MKRNEESRVTGRVSVNPGSFIWTCSNYGKSWGRVEEEEVGRRFRTRTEIRGDRCESGRHWNGGRKSLRGIRRGY